MGQPFLAVRLAVGVYEVSNKEERQQLEEVMRERYREPAKETCNALLEYAVKKDDRLRQIGEQAPTFCEPTEQAALSD